MKKNLENQKGTNSNADTSFDDNSYTNFHLYRFFVSFNMHISLCYREKFANNQLYEVNFEKSIRKANIDAVKALNNYVDRNRIVKIINDMDNINLLVSESSSLIDVSEIGNNEYVAELVNTETKELLDSIHIYAPNFETAKNRAELMLRYRVKKD